MALRTRMLAYYRDTSPLIGYYYAKGLLYPVDGLGEIDAVAKAMADAIDNATEGLWPGRWDMLRPMTAQELKATTVLALPLDEASAKVRTGAAGDDEADYALPIWAGVIPVRQQILAQSSSLTEAYRAYLSAHPNRFLPQLSRWREALTPAPGFAINSNSCLSLPSTLLLVFGRLFLYTNLGEFPERLSIIFLLPKCVRRVPVRARRRLAVVVDDDHVLDLDRALLEEPGEAGAERRRRPRVDSLLARQPRRSRRGHRHV